jgi:hypothetical protein
VKFKFQKFSRRYTWTPVKKGRDFKEGGRKGREVYDREWMGRKGRGGTKRKIRKEGRRVLIPRDKSWISHW